MIWNFCIRRPVLTVVVFLVFAIFGVYGFLQMPVQENPDVDFPIISVDVVLAGAAPEVLESEVIEPLEAEINTIEGLRTLNSTAREEVASIVAEFELWRDIDIAAQDVRDAIERSRRNLPEDADPPVVRKIDLNAQPIMWIALTGDERWDDVRLTEYADNVLRQRLETVRGVGQIRVGGQRKYAVRIRMDPELLAAHHLTVQDVIDTVQRENVDIPSGRIEGGQREFLVKTRGQFNDAEPFNDLIVAYRDGAPVRIRDIGEAVDGIENDRQIARFTGETSAGLGIVPQTGANVVEVADGVLERVEESSRDFPAGLQYRISTDSSEYIRENIRDLILTIFVATALVIFVVLLFLRSFKGTIVAGLAIPVSLLIGLAVINQFGFTINVLSMLALILVIGIVVDDAIVVLERCVFHLEKGSDPIPAARMGATEMAFPTIANSLALGAVFLPVAFTGGLIGRFFLEFGVTVAVTVFASTLVALTLTPMLCSRLLKPNSGRSFVIFRPVEWFLHRFENAYHATLRLAFKARPITILAGIGAFALGMWAVVNVESEFAPMEDRSQLLIIFETAVGTPLNRTDEFAKKIEIVLAEMDEVSHQFLAIGLSQGGPGEVNRGLSFVRLVPRSQRERHQEDIMQELRGRLSEIPDGRAFVAELTPGGLDDSPVAIVLQHPDLEMLAQVQDDVMQWMRNRSDMYVGVRTNLELDNPQVDVHIDRDRAAEMGVSVSEISNTLRFLLGSPTISYIERAAERYEVIPEVLGRGRLDPGVIEGLYVRNAHGELISLGHLVRTEETIGPSEISRYNRMRAATISSDIPPGVALGTAVDELREHVESVMAEGMSYEVAGQSEMFEESFFYLTLALAFSIVFIYLVLAAQFESFLLPLTIMAALPLATVGAFGSLWLLGMPFSIFAFIGLIMLLGLVTKNSILLVDYTRVLMARGQDPIDAAVNAGKERFRPVVMTAVSTMLGMMPLALGFGAGGEVRAPLGVSVAAGLFSSTALTLLVIPVLFSYTVQMRQAVVNFFSVTETGSRATATREATA